VGGGASSYISSQPIVPQWQLGATSHSPERDRSRSTVAAAGRAGGTCAAFTYGRSWSVAGAFWTSNGYLRM
jgi:hypothetical protein